ncbi:MAG: hypothetical protein GY799_12500 [Desulfobulbaceae bacterium]|nr:hypothetical protein [Desulfobulbaceae bacterium]
MGCLLGTLAYLASSTSTISRTFRLPILMAGILQISGLIGQLTQVIQRFARGVHQVICAVLGRALPAHPAVQDIEIGAVELELPSTGSGADSVYEEASEEPTNPDQPLVNEEIPRIEPMRI